MFGQGAIVHIGSGGPALCGYVPPNGWALSPDRWTAPHDLQNVSCAKCAAVLKQTKPAGGK